MHSQIELFGDTALPPGKVYVEEFLSVVDELGLLEHLATLPLQLSGYREFTAKRRTASYGFGYDFMHNRLAPATPVPPCLLPLRARVAAVVGIEAGCFEQALVTEYRPSTALGWHRDVPDFEIVAGVSPATCGCDPTRPQNVARGRSRSDARM